MRNIIVLALVAATVLALPVRAQELPANMRPGQIADALAANNSVLTAQVHVGLAASAAGPSATCTKTNHSDKLSAALLTCPGRVHDHGVKYVINAPPAVIAPPVASGDTYAGSGICAVELPFSTVSADLTPELRDNLDRVAADLRGLQVSNFKLLVEGHTDTVGAVGSNKDLSERRARTAALYIAAQSGFPVDRMIIRGVGKLHLIVNPPDQVDEPRNRVVVLGRAGV